MRRVITGAVIVLTLGAWARAADAASVPVINVNTFGIELCPQAICGAAIFTGLIQGQVGGNPNALGTFTAAPTHEPLPDPFQTANLTGGVFEFRSVCGAFAGSSYPAARCSITATTRSPWTRRC